MRRIDNLDAWLADLSSKFPRHVGNSVRMSLRFWRDYFGKVELAGEAQSAVALAVRRQGQLWRALLTGEKRAVDMLEPGDYIAAGQFLLTGTRLLATRALRAAFPLLLGLFLAVSVVLALVLVIAKTELVRVSASLFTLAAAITAGWRAVKPSLATAFVRVEAPLWSGALDEVIAHAMTLRPAKGSSARITKLDGRRVPTEEA